VTDPDHLHVLLVEDNPGDARLIREMLADAPGAPVEVVGADRLAAAVTRLAEGPVDGVLLDLSLPDSQGLATFSRLQAHAPAVPIVVLSGLADEAIALRAVQEGAQDYLVKGRVDGNLLVRALRYAVERKRAVEERARLLARERVARAEAERLAAERAAILGQIADGVIIADPTGRITFVNEAARRLRGPLDGQVHAQDDAAPYQLLTVEGRPYPPDERPLVRAALHGETVLDAELRIRQPDGTEIIVQGSATPVLAEDGSRLGAVLLLRDVTARHELERQKDEFIANVSHDLRTPLAGIKASIGVVLANEPAGVSEPLHRMFVNVDRAADRMAKLVDGLLELARLRAGRVSLRLGRCDLRELALQAAGAIEALAQERGQRVEAVVPPAPLWTLADGALLERVLMNLLANAHLHGRDGGVIRLSLEARGGQALYAVADDGPGIPIADQARVFERFYRSEKEGVRMSQGSGLGLPIAQALVGLHGGRIWVESEPGAGATFWVALPLEPAAAVADEDGVS
jgi:PAS domain S-box-containing protein